MKHKKFYKVYGENFFREVSRLDLNRLIWAGLCQFSERRNRWEFCGMCCFVDLILNTMNESVNKFSTLYNGGSPKGDGSSSLDINYIKEHLDSL